MCIMYPSFFHSQFALFTHKFKLNALLIQHCCGVVEQAWVHIRIELKQINRPAIFFPFVLLSTFGRIIC